MAKPIIHPLRRDDLTIDREALGRALEEALEKPIFDAVFSSADSGKGKDWEIQIVVANVLSEHGDHHRPHGQEKPVMFSSKDDNPVVKMKDGAKSEIKSAEQRAADLERKLEKANAEIARLKKDGPVSPDAGKTGVEDDLLDSVPGDEQMKDLLDKDPSTFRPSDARALSDEARREGIDIPQPVEFYAGSSYDSPKPIQRDEVGRLQEALRKKK